MIIEVDNLTKSYRQGDKEISVLKGLSFELNEGETLAILGRSGSGKSTLLSLLAGVDRADSGRIQFGDKDLVCLSEEELTRLRSRDIGIIFQQFHLLPHLKAWENVSLPLELVGESNAKERALAALADVGLAERAEHLPSELSGGEKQRVAVARSMVIRPALLLADEPSGSLDEKTGKEIMDLIFQLVEEHKMAMILVTHNRELAQRCHQVVTLQDGVLGR